MLQIKNTPQIYVACLSAYNNGYLHGAWIDCDKTAEELKEAIREMLSQSPVSQTEPCEGWAIHDYEGFFSYRVDEYERLETLSEIGALITNNDDAEIILKLMRHLDYDIEDSIDYFENNYQGKYDSDVDFAESFLEDTGDLNEIPEHLRCYFDYEYYARDLMNDYFEIKGHYFLNC